MQMQIFLCFRPYKESISEEMNNDNDLNLHLHDQMSGWLRYWLCHVLQSLPKLNALLKAVNSINTGTITPGKIPMFR